VQFDAERVAERFPFEDADGLWRVLEAVRIGGARSRSEVIEMTGLGRGVVAQRLAQLVRDGVVTEARLGPSTGGRPPRVLTMRPEAGRIVVADLGATSIDVALADATGRIVAHAAEPADIAAGPDAVLGRVEVLFDQLLADPHVRGRLLGIGIGVPGPVEFATGRPVAPPIMPGWDGHPVRERFASRFSAPVWVDNDVNIMALGEWRAGVARGHANAVWVKIGTGIGAGLISDGQLHRGAQGAAGDVGHIQVVDDAVVCRCGQAGCLEALAGGAAIARDALLAAREARSAFLAEALRRAEPVDSAMVARGAQHGDPVCVELLQRSGRYIGRMLASIVNFFNPSLIVVGGGVAASGDLLLAAIRETVYRRSLPLATRGLQVVPSALGPMAGVVGAAAMVADELYSRERLSTTLAWARSSPAADPSPALTASGGLPGAAAT